MLWACSIIAELNNGVLPINNISRHCYTWFRVKNIVHGQCRHAALQQFLRFYACVYLRCEGQLNMHGPSVSSPFGFRNYTKDLLMIRYKNTEDYRILDFIAKRGIFGFLNFFIIVSLGYGNYRSFRKAIRLFSTYQRFVLTSFNM